MTYDTRCRLCSTDISGAHGDLCIDGPVSAATCWTSLDGRAHLAAQPDHSYVSAASLHSEKIPAVALIEHILDVSLQSMPANTTETDKQRLAERLDEV